MPTPLKHWRKSLGWSQARASRELGCTEKTLRGWERGDVEPERRALLAAAWVWERERPFDPVPFEVPGQERQ